MFVFVVSLYLFAAAARLYVSVRLTGLLANLRFASATQPAKPQPPACFATERIPRKQRRMPESRE